MLNKITVKTKLEPIYYSAELAEELDWDMVAGELQPYTIAENIYQKQDMLRENIKTLVGVIQSNLVSCETRNLADGQVAKIIKNLITE
jgi:hypothetical protein